ncbi:protein of unknown function (plasmid) [Rhodovastum atsumiense]|nr:protein of unknown function [Rhodovastum atsumiense]
MSMVLLVEEGENIRASVEAFLEMEGYGVQVAGTARKR